MQDLINTDPAVNFITELRHQLSKADESEAWELRNNVMKEPNINFKVTEAVKNTLREVRFAIDFDFPEEAKRIQTNDQFFRFMEQYLPDVHSSYKLSMQTGDSKFLHQHLAKFVNFPTPQAEKKQGLFQQIFKS
ncbi:hypothetical protein [Roseateles sp. PN1]|uniref:hypothetical protein n=1 Tax=Roseateles sp. PN1 TaxID=3137372 RepID=UPI003138FC31